MIPSHSIFLRELFQSGGGGGVTRQKKAEDRIRELRKKARRPSGQGRDRRARIKRPSTRETLPETTRRPRGWAPSARRTRQRPPRSLVPGATCTEEREGQLKAAAWPGAMPHALLEGAPASVPAARSSPTPPPSRSEPARRDRGEVSRASLASSFRPSQLACDEVRRGARISAPLDSCPASSSIPLLGKRGRPLSSSRLLKTIPVTLGHTGGKPRRCLYRARPREPVEVKARSRELQRPTPSTSPAISLPSSPDVTPSPAAVKRPRRRWLPSMQEEGSPSRFQPPPPRVSGASKWRLAF